MAENLFFGNLEWWYYIPEGIIGNLLKVLGINCIPIASFDQVSFADESEYVRRFHKKIQYSWQEESFGSVMWINGFFFLAGKLTNLFPVLLAVVQAKDWQSAWSSCWRLLYAWAWNLRGCSIRYLNNICKEQQEEERWLWKLEEGWPCLCWYSTSVFTSLLHVWPVGLLTRTLTPASAAATMLVGSSYPIHLSSAHQVQNLL